MTPQEAERLLAYPVPGLIITRGLDAFPECLAMAEKHGRTVLRTKAQTSAFMSALIGSLYNRLAPRVTRSGVMELEYGEGILLQGESGVGKSEVAIELIKRGHRLIADDAVEIKETNPCTLEAARPGTHPPLYGTAGHRSHQCEPPWGPLNSRMTSLGWRARPCPRPPGAGGTTY